MIGALEAEVERLRRRRASRIFEVTAGLFLLGALALLGAFVMLKHQEIENQGVEWIWLIAFVSLFLLGFAWKLIWEGGP